MAIKFIIIFTLACIVKSDSDFVCPDPEKDKTYKMPVCEYDSK